MYKDVETDNYFPFWVLPALPSVTVSVDFVDFLIGQVFLNLVQKWADSLEEINKSPTIEKLVKSHFDWRTLFDGVGLVGFSAFLFVFGISADSSAFTTRTVVFLLSLGGVLYAVFSLVLRYFAFKFERVLSRSVVGSMVILTQGDEIFSSKIIEQGKSTKKRLLQYASSGVVAVLLNVLSSYIFAWLHP